MIGLASVIIGGVVDWVKGDQELKKIKSEGKIEIEKAKTQATIVKISKELDQDHDYNMIMAKNMERSWKDEFVLVIVSIPLIQNYYYGGFEALDALPLWYQVLVIGIFFSIYGLKDIFKVVLQLLLNRKSKK